MATIVGSLVTNLTLESASFVSNMKRAADSAEKGATSIERAFGAAKAGVAGFLAAFSVDAVARITQQSLDYAGSIGEVAQQLGVTTRDLQVYRFAATQAGISQEVMEQGLAKLTRSIGENNSAFAELGISTKNADGSFRSTGDVMRDVIAKLSAIPDAAKRAAIEVALFGRAGQKLDTLLAGGIGQVDALAQSAQRLGVVLSDQQIQKADEAADKLAALKTVLTANIAGVVADNAGAILSFANALMKVGSAFGSVVNQFRGTARIYESEGVLGVLGSSWQRLDQAATAGGRQFQIDQELKGLGGGRGAALRRAQLMAERRALQGEVSADFRALVFSGLPKGNSAADAAAKANAAGSGRAGGAGAGKKTDTVADFLADIKARKTAIDALSESLGRPLTAEELGIDLTAEKLADIGDIGQTALGKITAEGERLGDVLTKSLDDAKAAQERFASNISQNLAYAIVQGQSLGTALVNSLKAAAAEALSNGLFK
ncbi:MAG: phage tail tape measure protein, partial [Alphaproteobacteria bacterium]|nr:phage tail tape measure protein [Alphaproteobacteria bacterium]